MDASEAARSITAECLCFRARRTARAITRLYDEALRPLGLQATQLTLLNAVVIGAERTGAAGPPMRWLAESLAMDLTTLSRNLRPLEALGLVAIGRQEGDRRVRVVRLMPAGEAAIAAALPRWQAAHARVVHLLGVAQAEDLRRALDAATRATAAAASAGKDEISGRAAPSR